MLVLITYDIKTTDPSAPQKLRKIAKICCNYGQRVQYSVFECLVNPAQLVKLKALLVAIVDPKIDSLRIYYLGSNYKKNIEQIGVQKNYEMDEPLIF